MRIRSVYFKVKEMPPAVSFWRSLLQLEPIKESSHWSEFKVGEVRLGFLLNDFGEEISGNSSVPVIELEPSELLAFIERAKSHGATVVLDGLDNPIKWLAQLRRTSSKQGEVPPNPLHEPMG